VAASPLPIDEVCDKPQQVGPEQERSQGETQQPKVPELESIDLGGGGFIEVDEQGVPLVMSRPKPRGLLPVPPEVEAIIAKEEARLLNEKGIVPTPEARQRMVDSFTLQYYYEGFYVAYRPTPQGPEVLAVGPDEIGQLLGGMDPEERLKIKVGQP
jgi:hypothetical protein